MQSLGKTTSFASFALRQAAPTWAANNGYSSLRSPFANNFVASFNRYTVLNTQPMAITQAGFATDAKDKAAKEKEKEKEKAQREKERARERAVREKEKEKEAKQKERERALVQKEREAQKKEGEKEKAKAKRTRDQEKRAAEKEKEKETARKLREKERSQKLKEREQQEKERVREENLAIKEELARIPKRPKSSFFFFVQQERPALLAVKDANIIEVSKKLGEMWKALSPEQRKPYESKAAEDKVRAGKERAEYEKTLPPKRPQGPYIIFANEIRPEVTKANPNEKITKIGALIAERWRALSEETKKSYSAKAQVLREKYDKEFSAWEKAYEASLKK